MSNLGASYNVTIAANKRSSMIGSEGRWHESIVRYCLKARVPTKARQFNPLGYTF